MWKHLLVPVDFSECGARALELALSLARCHGAKLTLVHVSPLPPNLPVDMRLTPPGEQGSMRIDDYMREGAQTRLDRIADPLRGREIDVQTLAVITPSSDIADELLGVVTRLGVDAIVVGTHGRTGLAHLFLGSVAEKIIRRASVPVITIRASSPEAALTREELVAEDELTG